jgi:hypothetical protein
VRVRGGELLMAWLDFKQVGKLKKVLFIIFKAKIELMKYFRGIIGVQGEICVDLRRKCKDLKKL